MILTLSRDIEGELLVKKGQKVDTKTPFLKKHKLKNFEVAISRRLNIPPNKIFHYLKKLVGDRVRPGDILAEKKEILGKKKYINQIDGVIREVNHSEGILIIAQEADEQIFTTGFAGEIVDIKDNVIKIEVKEIQEFKFEKTSGDFAGETFFLTEPSSHDFTENSLDDKVVFADKLNDYDKAKLEVIGACGIITASSFKEGADSNIPQAKLKSTDDFKEIQKLNFPYCAVVKKSNILYLYK